MVKVSIIVPVYKVEKYLARCVESLLGQTLSDIEIILVDDGSPDNCPALCDEWASKDDKIKVIHKENAGLGYARNSGLDVAVGEYVGFVDSDDYIEIDMYEKLYAAAVKYNAEFALTGFKCIGGIMVKKEDSVSIINNFEKETVFNGKEGIDELLLNIAGARPEDAEDSKYGFSSVKNLYKNSVIKENKIRFESERQVMSEDIFFVLDFLKHTNNAVGIEGAHYCYCRNEDSLSKSYRSDRFEKSRILVRKINEYLAERMPVDVYGIYTDRLLQAYARADLMQEIQFKDKNGITNNELNNRLREICNCPELKALLKRYPWHKLPFTQRVFAFTMRFNLIFLMKILMKIKEKM